MRERGKEEDLRFNVNYLLIINESMNWKSKP